MDDAEEKKVKQNLVNVRALEVLPKSALVEWFDKSGQRRAFIPTEHLLSGGAVDNTVLEAGIPYGVAWEEVKFTTPTPAALAQALRAGGIWTKADLFANPQKAVGILQAIYQVDLSALIEFAERHEKE